MAIEDTELLVSVLNAIVEKEGYDPSIYGFGYTDDGTISFADNCGTFRDGLEFMWVEIIEGHPYWEK